MKKCIILIACLIVLPVLAFAGPTIGTITDIDVSGGNARISVQYTQDNGRTELINEVETPVLDIVGRDSFYVSNSPALVDKVKQAIAAKAKAYDDAIAPDTAAIDAAKAAETAARQAKIDALAISKGDEITAADLD